MRAIRPPTVPAGTVAHSAFAHGANFAGRNSPSRSRPDPRARKSLAATCRPRRAVHA